MNQKVGFSKIKENRNREKPKKKKKSSKQNKEGDQGSPSVTVTYKNMYKNNKKYIKNQGVRGSVYKGCLLLIFLAVVMVVFIVAMLKSNLERIPNQNIYMPITENSMPLCRSGQPKRVHMKNIHLT